MVGEHLRRAQRKIGRSLAPRLGRSDQGPEGPGSRAFRLYLERHIELDGDEHGPMAEQLLMRLCGSDPQKWKEAEASAARALKARHGMWESVAKTIVVGEIDG